ncbi:MAG: HAD family hydrolase [Marinilabiliales bacterium]|nr:MAG: HAD family hydrolase [Marinilabiliales bacterium]
MKKAVFFDRDGVINKGSSGYIFKNEDFIINDDVIKAMKILHDNGFKLFVITNQGGISKNLYSKNEVLLLHKLLNAKCIEKGFELTDIYFCPHHDENENCLCRKPKPLLLEKAIARFHLNKKKSWFIGDREKDEMAGQKAGINTIRIKENEALLPHIDKIIKD